MAEPYAIKMPQLSDTMTEGVIVSWEKNIGDAVARGDIVATVETDKAVMDVEIFRDGFLSGPLAAIDATVPVTGAIGFIVASKDDVVEGEAEAGGPCSGNAGSCCSSPPGSNRQRQSCRWRKDCSGLAPAGRQGLATGAKTGGTGGCRHRTYDRQRSGRRNHCRGCAACTRTLRGGCAR